MTAESATKTEGPSCGRCRHWDRKDEDYQADRVTPPEGLEAHVCVKPVMLWDASEYFRQPSGGVTRRLKEEHKDQLSFVQDASDYCALLVTRAEFYCAHFEKREG